MFRNDELRRKGKFGALPDDAEVDGDTIAVGRKRRRT